jgi:Domain of unknown function (DUF4259)
MGAWDVGTFDNETACDWAFELEDTGDLSLVQATVEAVLEVGDGYLAADLGCEALAAGEVIARLLGSGGERNAHTRTIDEWVEAHPITPSTHLVAQAVSAIDRIVSPDSELLELWTESNDLEKWRAVVADLRARLRG